MKQGATFLIVGLGLMGGSYAMGLHKKGYRVTGITRSKSSMEWALEQRLVDDGTIDADKAGVQRLAAEADYVLLALYPDDILAWLQEYHAFLKPGAVLTDLAGVKSCFVPQAQEILGDKHEFIPCHPMAGREVSGVQNATDAILQGANYIITPTERNTPEGVLFARKLAVTLGFGHIIELSIEEHDSMIGYVSQLTHAIAVSLMNANDDPRLPEVTGDSFRDLTRIADINAELWSELFFSNAEALTQEIDQFTEALQELRRCVAVRDEENLKKLFRQSGVRRRAFAKKDKGQ